MNLLENNEIYKLQVDYINGTGEHGVVHKKYAGILEKYKRLYAECPIFNAVGLLDLYKEDTARNGVFINVALIVFSFIGFKGWAAWLVMAFITAIVKYLQIETNQFSDDDVFNNRKENMQYQFQNVSLSTFTEASGRWFLLPLVVLPFLIIAPVVSISANWAWVVLNTPIIIDLYKEVNEWKIVPQKSYSENKKSVIRMQQAEAGLEQIRKQLAMLLPELQAEYREELNRIISDGTTSKRHSIVQTFGRLPEHFWWEITPSQLLEKQMLLESTREMLLESHQVAMFDRTLGNEFQNAWANYAPMYAEKLTKQEMNQIYQKNIQLVRDKGGVILDFVDCIKYPDMVTEYELVKDYDYAENSFTRAFDNEQWKALGKDIDEAHRDEILTKSEYEELRNRYNELDPDVRGYINRKIEVGDHVENKKEYRIFSRFEWTGQALLIPDPQISGGYILLDYRCRPEYEFDNLEQLKPSLMITQIMADYVSGKQDFIAYMHKMLEKSKEIGEEVVVRQNQSKEQILAIISIALVSCFRIPMIPIVGIVLGIISRKKGGGILAVIGIIVNIVGLIGQMFFFFVFNLLLSYH
ncbi:MAG: DUF4190 domain-containing protein [Lachnospiraceae bacterium]|nr:DUF4190 domain-containing protein [Lachnospiraceae bacterium]